MQSDELLERPASFYQDLHTLMMWPTLWAPTRSLTLPQSPTHSLTHTLSPLKHLINLCNHPPKITTSYLMHSTHLILERCKFIYTFNQKLLHFTSTSNKTCTLYVRSTNAFHFSLSFVYIYSKCKCSLNATQQPSTSGYKQHTWHVHVFRQSDRHMLFNQSKQDTVRTIITSKTHC